MSLEGVSQEEHNGAHFSFVAPSSEELRIRKEIDQNALLYMYIVQGFRPKTERNDLEC